MNGNAFKCFQTDSCRIVGAAVINNDSLIDIFAVFLQNLSQEAPAFIFTTMVRVSLGRFLVIGAAATSLEFSSMGVGADSAFTPVVSLIKSSTLFKSLSLYK